MTPVIPLSQDDLRKLSPSLLVRRFGAEIVAAARGQPILDVACGGGRNALLLAHFGGHVICIDNDLSRLESEIIRLGDTIFEPALSRIELLSLDLMCDEWPFPSASVGGIVNVHFLNIALFPSFARSASPGSCLLLETVPGCGGNYLQLPKAGTLRQAFENFFDFEIYKERKVGVVRQYSIRS
ncbi:MAG: class I SAM-dependent methyltransferase [Bryobacteraceae bacterium]